MSQKLGDISSGDLTEWLSARGLSSETCDALACAGLGGATLLELCEDDLADEELGLEPDEIAKLLELIVAAQQARDDDDEDGDGGDADGEASALAIGGSFGTLLSVGLVCFDITMIIAELPHADSKMRAQRSVHGAGGNAANTCVACCRLAPAGLAPHKKVRLLTRLGDDALAAQIGDELRGEGVDLSLARTAAGGRTATSVVLVAGATRTIVHDAAINDAAPLSAEELCDAAEAEAASAAADEHARRRLLELALSNGNGDGGDNASDASAAVGTGGDAGDERHSLQSLPPRPPLAATEDHGDGEVARALRTLMNDVTLLHLDGRHPAAALAAARGARACGVPILIDAERARDGLDSLMALADFVVASEAFAFALPAALPPPAVSTSDERCCEPPPTTSTAADDDLAAARRVLAAAPRARWVIVTLGSRGAIALERAAPAVDGDEGRGGVVRAPDGATEAAGDDGGLSEADGPPLPAATVDVQVGGGGGGGDATVTRVATWDLANVRAHLRRLARQRRSRRGGVAAEEEKDEGDDACDTTGAGDAYIGALAHLLRWRRHSSLPARRDARGGGGVRGESQSPLPPLPPLELLMRFAGFVAAANCTGEGARGGLPRESDLPPALTRSVASWSTGAPERARS